ncbi:MAG: sulfatase-like hydrolase/transferase [Bacteroidia bacterium]|nr:sulfatase-like hydrolase/transferase [Bacteroidia bacterium]
MKKRLLIYFYYLLFWLVFFWAGKLVFLVFHFSLSKEIAFADWLRIFIYGFRLDFSSAGYLMLFPGIVIILTSYFSGKWLYYILNVYTVFILLINIILLIGDLELYTHWRYRMDCTPLLYLNKPGEVFGSVSVWVIIRQILIGIFLLTIFIYGYFKLIAVRIKQMQKSNWKSMIVFLLIAALGFIQMRGGLSLVPINISSAYFHNNVFVNHAAVNLFWNVGHSLIESSDLKSEYQFFSDAKAKSMFHQLYPDTADNPGVLKNKRPDIVLIILESFTAKAVKAVGGKDGITPNFNALCKEGLLFDNFYASGDRSDKGIAAILSGYPAQPNTSIMKYPEKTLKLPFLSKILREQGYSTAFYYGGDPDFANIKAYLLNGKFDRIISKKDFDSKYYNAKWGVHDHIVFDRFLQDIENTKSPFFKVLFTLSSHDPYDVPMPTAIKGGDYDSLFLNSLYYTDKCIGDFIKKAKTKKWWENTLVIFTADHGSLRPGNYSHFDPASYKIPMVWIGGALTPKDSTVHTYSSQTDIAKTVLQQMGLQNKDFLFAQNILSLQAPSFSFYTFNNGFGFLSGYATQIYDNISAKYIICNGPDTLKYYGYDKAYLQVLYDDFLKK